MNNKLIIAEATRRASEITNSVLVTARLLKVTPSALAQAIVDEEANGNYLADFTAALVKAELARAREETANS